MDTSENKYVGLVAASDMEDGDIVVVECPAFEAEVGGIVEFKLRGMVHRAIIEEVISVAATSREWHFAARLSPIYGWTRLWPAPTVKGGIR